MRRLFAIAMLLTFSACATPYRPAVIAKGSTTFAGVADLLASAGAVDVIMIHGMCTHDSKDAHDAMDEIVAALGANVRPQSRPPDALRSLGRGAVEIVERDDQVGGSLRYRGIVWSGLTTPLKEQLQFDRSGVPNDCASAEPGTCKPRRAKLNADLKDGLLNDCLADALIYQGESRKAIRDAVVAALDTIMTASQDDGRPIVLVTESLGSKIAFDALDRMLDAPEGTTARTSARRLARQLATVFMQANQLPILSLADQHIGASANAAAPAAASRSMPQPLRRLAEERAGERGITGRSTLDALKVVAFTDPNDLLSYRLLGSRFAGDPSIEFADVLVSNAPTYVGLLENPLTAHTSYPRNPDVARLIACGEPRSGRCRWLDR